jgi:hypothetical protein
MQKLTNNEHLSKSSAFGNKWFRMLVLQRFGKHCICRLQGKRLLSGWRVGCEGRDWRNRGAGCYPIGGEHVLEMRWLKICKCHVVSRTGDERNFSNHVIEKDTVFSDHVVRKSSGQPASITLWFSNLPSAFGVTSWTGVARYKDRGTHTWLERDSSAQSQCSSGLRPGGHTTVRILRNLTWCGTKQNCPEQPMSVKVIVEHTVDAVTWRPAGWWITPRPTPQAPTWSSGFNHTYNHPIHHHQKPTTEYTTSYSCYF